MKRKMILALLASLLAFGCLGTWGMNQQIHTICVKNKFIDSGGESGSHYIIIATNNDAYEIDRSYFNMFNKDANPDVIYTEIKANTSYTITTTGYRIDWDYDYPLIQRIEEIGKCS